MDARLKSTILIVEDEIPLQKVVGFKLKNAGFNVISARKAEEAINYIKTAESIDLVWLDHYLIGTKTGLDIVKIIKNSSEFKHIPIFVVTNSADLNKKHAYIKFGIEKYFIKSDLRLDEVIDAIKASLKE